MNRATHTPGPWKYDGSSDPLPHDYACSTERIAAGGVTIAEVATCEDDSCPGVSEGWANARLIAAAPELLAACRELLAAFIDRGNGFADCDLHDHPRRIVNRAAEAIAKAEMTNDVYEIANRE